MSTGRNYYDDDDFRKGGYDGDEYDEDDAIDRFIGDRSRRNTEQEKLRERMDHYVGDSYHHLSRESEAARQVLADGRVSQNPYARRQSGYTTRDTQRANTNRNNHAKNNSYRGQSSRSSGQKVQSAPKSPRGDEPANGKSRGIIKTLLLAFIGLIIVYYGAMSVATSGVNRVEVDTSQSIAPVEEISHIEARSSTAFVKNVLLLGIDDDGGKGSRSDTIMIASVDSRSNTVRLCSILRDNYVAIPGHRSSRINSAYAYGGAELTMQTIEANYRMHLDDYVSISMDALISVVDAVGGVNITISSAEAKQINRYSYSENTAEAGDQHLDGKQAVCYARIRKIDSDFGRTSRQRTLINAIVAKCRTLSPGKLLGLVKTVSPYLTTNMSSAEIATLGLKVLPALGNEIEQLSLPIEGSYRDKTIDGMAVLKSDLEANTNALHEFIYGE